MLRKVAPIALSLFALTAFFACETETPTTLQTAQPLVRISPTVGGQGMAITMTLRGINTQWAQGDLEIDLGDGFTIGAVTLTACSTTTWRSDVRFSCAVIFSTATESFASRTPAAISRGTLSQRRSS